MYEHNLRSKGISFANWTNVKNIVAKTKRRSSVYTSRVVSPYFCNNFVEPALDVQKPTVDDILFHETNVATSNCLKVFQDYN